MNRYNYGKRQPSGSDMLGLAFTAIILAIISLGVLYMNVSADADSLATDLELLRKEVSELRQAAEDSKERAAAPTEKKKEQPAPKYYNKKAALDTARQKEIKKAPEKAIIQIPISTETKDTAR